MMHKRGAMLRQHLVVVIASALMVAFGQIAWGADVLLKAAPAPVANPTASWNGFYAGINGGYASGSSIQTDATVLSTSTFVANATSQAAAASSNIGKEHGGFIGGDQVGFNYVVTPALLIGVETDIQAAALRQTGNIANLTQVPGSGAPALATWQTQIAASRSVDYLGTLRGRIGSTLISDWLIYGTGGLAYGHVSSSTSVSQQGVTGNPPASAVLGTFDATRIGWSAGVGAEWMFTSNWTAKLEYLHFDLGSATYSNGTLAFNMTPTPFNGTGISSVASSSTVHFSGDVVRVGVNYRFR
jgi:outer membrane immunogenic protein